MIVTRILRESPAGQRGSVDVTASRRAQPRGVLAAGLWPPHAAGRLVPVRVR